MKTFDPLKAVRRHCLDCSADSALSVKYCPCDGVHSTRCHLWPYRFGRRPATASKKYGLAFVTPGAIPGPGVMLEDCERVMRGEEAQSDPGHMLRA